MATAEFKTIGNVKQFLELQTRHAQKLAHDGILFNSPIPAALAPFTRVLGPWPGADDMAWDFLNPDGEGRAVSPEEKARIGGFDTRQIVAKPNIEIAGHTFRVSPKNDFRHGGMSLQIAQEKITRPHREWNRAVARELVNVVTCGAYKNSGTRTEGYTFTIKDFNGTNVAIQSVTESANQATPTVAGSHHVMQFPDRHGDLLSAGHDHVPADAGGVWTEALGKTARDHILEHPGNHGVDAYVGESVVDEIEAQIESVRASTESGVQFEMGGATEQDFGIPTYIGMHDNVRYFRWDDLPANLGLYMARGRKPLALSVGIQRADGVEMPKAWNNARVADPETEAIEYGFRGPTGAHVVEPTSIYIANYA